MVCSPVQGMDGMRCSPANTWAGVAWSCSVCYVNKGKWVVGGCRVASCHHSLHSFVSIVPVQKPHSVPPVRAFLSVMVAADLPGFGHLSGSIL